MIVVGLNIKIVNRVITISTKISNIQYKTFILFKDEIITKHKIVYKNIYSTPLWYLKNIYKENINVKIHILTMLIVHYRHKMIQQQRIEILLIKK